MSGIQSRIVLRVQGGHKPWPVSQVSMEARVKSTKWLSFIDDFCNSFAGRAGEPSVCLHPVQMSVLRNLILLQYSFQQLKASPES